MKATLKKSSVLLLNELKHFLTKNIYSLVVVLCDENTHKHCYPFIHDAFGKHKVIVVESGEINKTLHTCQYIWEQLSEFGADRHSLLVNLGGGVICDMGGFAASVYKRGIDFVHIPTSLLAMCDSCIGGKTAVDFDFHKNIIGTFNDAEAVFIYPGFLKTLQPQHLISGFAEMLKHAIIKGKKEFEIFENLNQIPDDFIDLIYASLLIKNEIILKDPFESGHRKILNFGHTIGHALESFFLEHSHENPITHGEAVAVGMVVESKIARTMKLLSQTDFKRICECIMKFYTIPHIADSDISEVLARCSNDKKNRSGKILCSLPAGIGKVKSDYVVTLSQLKSALKSCI